MTQPNPFDPTQNPNYGPRPSFEAAQTPRPRESLSLTDGAALLDHVSSYIRRYVSASKPQVVTLALWAVHTYLLGEIDFTPYLAITSAEKESGKTRVLEVLNTLVKTPWQTAQPSPAALFRTIDKKQPTLLMDESDATFNSDKEYSEALRGILNSGYQRGGVTPRCVGKDFEVKDFPTFCPKAIAGIGKLPGTVASRSIPIRLKRAARGTVSKFRKHDAEVESSDIRTAIKTFADRIRTAMGGARPELPDELSDRQQDAVEPLVAVADLAGGNWPELARTSLVSLCVEAQSDDDSVGVRLLSDIRDVFEVKAVERISSTELAKSLADIETSPWAEWFQGKPITANKVAKLLKPYGIESKHSRAYRGYDRTDFQEPWSLYLPSGSVTSVTSAVSASNERVCECDTSNETPQPVTLQKPNKPTGINGVTLVTLPSQGEGGCEVQSDKLALAKNGNRLDAPSVGYTLLGAPGLDCTCNSCSGRFRTVAGWRAHVARSRCVRTEAAD